MTLIRAASAVAMVLASLSIASPSNAGVSPAGAQDTLARAKDLYTSAAYDEALEVLNTFDKSSGADSAEADQYRAFCLLALGRSDDARKVIEQIVEANPSFQPSESQVSPRLKEAFREVRRRVLPSVVKQTYGEAKAAYDRKDLDAAGTRFGTVVALLGDADLVASADLSDLKVLSQGFLDLIKTTAKPAAEPAPAAPPPPPAVPEAPARSIFGPNDADVTPPVAISQVMPPWHPSRADVQTHTGTVVIVIDETGSVASLNPQGDLPAAYVTVLRRAAQSWKFQPATRNGQPVKYLKVVGVKLNPTD